MVKEKRKRRKEITWTLYVFGVVVVVGIIVAFDHIGKSDA